MGATPGLFQQQVSPTGQLNGICRSALEVVGPQTALTAITTAQTLASLTLPAGILNVLQRTLRIRASLVYDTTSTNVATLTLAIKLGSVTVLTITTDASNTAASTNLPVQLDATIATSLTGASGTVEAHGSVDADLGTATSAAITRYLDGNHAASSAVNLASSLALTVTIAASAAVPRAQLRQLVIEVAN